MWTWEEMSRRETRKIGLLSRKWSADHWGLQKKQVFHIPLFWIGWALLCWLKRWYLWRDILIKLKRDSVWLTFTNLTLLKPLGLKVLPISPILRTWSRNLFLLSSEISWKVYVSNLVDCNQNFTKRLFRRTSPCCNPTSQYTVC